MWTRSKTRAEDAYYNEDKQRFYLTQPVGTKRRLPERVAEDEIIDAPPRKRTMEPMCFAGETQTDDNRMDWEPST